jgi:hypothetical protein
MNFFAWLVLGLVAYTSGFSIRHFRYKGTTLPNDKKWQYVAIFFCDRALGVCAIEFICYA